jgi:hypothetical protein
MMFLLVRLMDRMYCSDEDKIPDQAAHLQMQLKL